MIKNLVKLIGLLVVITILIYFLSEVLTIIIHEGLLVYGNNLTTLQFVLYIVGMVIPLIVWLVWSFRSHSRFWRQVAVLICLSTYLTIWLMLFPNIF